MRRDDAVTEAKKALIESCQTSTDGSGSALLLPVAAYQKHARADQ
jgi:hypothetical protein